MNQPLEIEVEALKSRVHTLEAIERDNTSRWVAWTKSTKDMGQKIMIALEQIVTEKTH